jgi:hypothetical protein
MTEEITSLRGLVESPRRRPVAGDYRLCGRERLMEMEGRRPDRSGLWRVEGDWPDLWIDATPRSIHASRIVSRSVV